MNGQRIGAGPAASDLPHWRYETFDLAPALRTGANLLTATVWNFGIYSAVSQMSDRTALLVQAFVGRHGGGYCELQFDLRFS